MVPCQNLVTCPGSCTHPLYILVFTFFFLTSYQVIGTEYIVCGIYPSKGKHFHQGTDEKKTQPPCHTQPHSYLTLAGWRGWQSGSVQQFYLLPANWMTLDILEVCFDNEVNNHINVIHCKLVRKQVCTDEWQTPVSLQTVGFFGTVRRVSWVPVMNAIYFNTVVPIQSVAKLCCREKNGAMLQKDIQDCVTLAPCLYSLLFLLHYAFLWNLEDKIVLHVLGCKSWLPSSW